MKALMLTLLALLLCADSRAAEWVRAGVNTNQPIWGLRGGLQFAVHPGSFRGREGGPRGLIRLGYTVHVERRYDLINFIAVEPVVQGRKGFSELEHSKLDNRQGKRMWAGDSGDGQAVPALDPGNFSQPAPGVEQLEVTLRVEKFDNGAHVRLVLAQRSDAPDEVALNIRMEPDSAPLEYCILTATMGNLARTRQLWLKDEIVSSLKLYPNYKGAAFAEHTRFPLDRLFRTPAGDVLVAVTTDEEHPAAARPFPNTDHWYYGGAKVTQYWRKPNGACRADLHAVVNARFTYWQSQQPIPGGIAFENFELRERFYKGQQFLFGITRQTPRALGLARATESPVP